MFKARRWDEFLQGVVVGGGEKSRDRVLGYSIFEVRR